MGHIAGPEEKRAQYAVDEVFYADELEQVLNKKRPEVVYLLEGVNSDRYIPCLQLSYLPSDADPTCTLS